MGGDTTITNDVLAERIANFSNDLHNDLGRIEKQLAQLVPREVYDAHRVSDLARILALEKRAEDAEVARKADAKTAAEQRRQTFHLMLGTVFIPVVLFIWGQWLAARGGKP